MDRDEDTGEVEKVVLAATGRARITDAIAWIAEGHPIAVDVSWPTLLQAVVECSAPGSVGDTALRRVVREACQSDVDTAKVVFNSESLPKPSDYRKALDELLSRTASHSFTDLTPRSVQRAHYANGLAIEALCLAVGVSYGDACDWFGVGAGGWNLEKISRLLEYLDCLVRNSIRSPIVNSIPARALELTQGNENEWSALDSYHNGGVPYEVLLAQRAAGGVWLAHKNKTSSFPNIAAAEVLCAELKVRGIDFRRATTVGGTSRQTDLQTLSGIPKKQVGLVVLKNEIPTFAIAFSSARDGGTARANGDGLLQIPLTSLPMALMLTGLGWAMRPETDRLAKHFEGRLFTERTTSALIQLIEESNR